MTRSGKAAPGRLSRAAFELLAESIPHIVWLADTAGSVDYVNDRGTAYTGYPRLAHYGWNWVDWVHSDDAERARMGWRHATTTKTPFELTYRIRRNDGQFRWHVCRALPVWGSSGQILRWIGTADDLDDPPPRRDLASYLERQARELRTLLEATGPADRPGSVESRRRRARVDTEPDTATYEPISGTEQPAAEPAGGLSPRELVVLRLLAAGYTNAEIAHLLDRSLRTIEATRSRLRERLGLRTRAELVRFAHEALVPAGAGSDTRSPTLPDLDHAAGDPPTQWGVDL